MQDLATIISNFGFPIALVAYLLTRWEKKIDKLNDSISGENGLNVKVRELTEVMKNLSKKK